MVVTTLLSGCRSASVPARLLALGRSCQPGLRPATVIRTDDPEELARIYARWRARGIRPTVREPEPALIEAALAGLS